MTIVKKVLFVANYHKGLGGISGQVEALVKNLSLEDGIVVGVFSTKGSVIQRLLYFFSLLLKARKYDVLHVHGCSYLGFLPVVYGVMAGKLWRKRVVVTYHGGEAEEFFSKYPRWVRFWLMKADKRVVLSDFLRVVFDKFSIPACVIPNIVETRKDLYVAKTELRPRFISVRHLKELYNIPCVLRAFARVQQQLPESELTVLGDGEQRSMLENMVKEMRLEKVSFVGQVPNEEIWDYLKTNDIILSSPWADNMPVSLLEAFSAGLLVISSNVGGVPYLVDNGSTGLLFDPDDDQGMASQMLWALSHQKESLEMIAKARKKVEEFSWDNIREKIVSLYE